MTINHRSPLLILAGDPAGPDLTALEMIINAVYYAIVIGIPLFAALSVIYVVVSVYKNRHRKPPNSGG